MIDAQEKKAKNNDGFFYLGKKYIPIYCDDPGIKFVGDKVYLNQISASGSYFTPPHDGYRFKVYRNGRIKQEIYFDLYDEVSESILEEEVISVEELNIYLEQYKNNCSIVIKVGN